MNYETAELPFDRRADYASHLKRLRTDDRVLRFWASVGDASIDMHVAGLPKDAAILVVEKDGVILGALEAIPSRRKDGSLDVEFGVSVDPDHRGGGVAHALVEAAIRWSFDIHAADLHATCLTRNTKMIALAKAHGMSIRREDGEILAVLPLAA